ncbi:NCAM [Mytilus coruscus]|uniref:NCAM n=1 Tax=Mytilus coruscus TaxID=42192 RepID=A0A6J8DXL2_MYTCO|nr:NCAM [Mytilus coruscus]
MKKTCKTILFLVWIHSNILTTANGKPRYTYFSEGETVILMCMGDADANATSWIGPAHNTSIPSPVPEVDDFGNDKIWNTTVYTNGRKINPDIQNFRRLKVVDMGGNGDFDLQISNASTSDEGFYRCEIESVEGKLLTKQYILQLKKPPSNLTIDNETEEDTIIGREDQILKIACNVESGSPPSTILWKHNGTILKTGGPKRIIYEFRTDRTHHNAKFTCEVISNLTDEHLIKTIRLDIKYRPKVLINHNNNMPVFERANTTLCCKIDSNPNISFIFWSKDSIGFTNSRNSSCLLFKRLDRQDSGNYTCFAGNEIGNGSFETTLTVYYPPSVYLEYKNFSINESKRAVQCKADGIPNNITFFRLEHLSDFNEHIRYLDVSSDGIAKLPNMSESKRYQDTGFYLCTASNGVSDEKGNMFQHDKAYLVSTGPPVFVDDNRKIQYGQIGKPMDIRINVFSTSAIKCLDLNAIGRVSSPLPIKNNLTKTVPMKIDFHGVNITVNGTELTFRLSKWNSFESYNVTVSNHFFENYFIVEVRQTGK